MNLLVSEEYLEKLLNVDFRKEGEKGKILDYLSNIPQIEKAYGLYDGSEGDISEWILEKYLHKISIRKGYQVINIQPFYGKGHKEFVFYTSSAKRISDNVWIGNAYGLSLYEVISKLIILINKDIKYPRDSGDFKYE